MSDIVELERRITAALDRIQRGVAGMATPAAARDDLAPASPPSDAGWQNARIAQLESLLSDERTVTAQFEERVRALKNHTETAPAAPDTAALAEAAAKARQDAEAAFAATLFRMKSHLGQLETEIDGMRRSNADLREMIARLRGAMAEGVATPELVNRAMKAELDALRATRAADAAELDAVIEELRPLIEEAR